MNGPTTDSVPLVMVSATGMLGSYALRYALDHPAVARVTAFGRRKLGISHPKLDQVLHQDFADCSALAGALSDQGGAVYCWALIPAPYPKQSYATLPLTTPSSSRGFSGRQASIRFSRKARFRSATAGESKQSRSRGAVQSPDSRPRRLESVPHSRRRRIDRGQGWLIYTQCRGLHARRAVEFGTSYGVSTLYLAAAMRDQGTSLVIGTEIEAERRATRATISSQRELRN
jgi:hypothetical protein